MKSSPTEIELDIETISHEGLGFAQTETRPMHVRNALPGERVTARILKKRKGQLYGDAVDVVHVSKSRVSSACDYFPRCGGCNMHHIDPRAQLELKEGWLRNCLQENGIQPVAWNTPQRAGLVGYRHKARLGVRKVAEQVFVGFRESFASRVSRMDQCAVLTPELSRLVKPLKDALGAMEGAHRIPQIELAQGDDGVALLVRHLDPLSEADLASWRSFEKSTQARIYLQSGGYDTLEGLDGRSMDLLHYTVKGSGLVLAFYPHQFVQVNFAMNQVLIEHILAYLDPLSGQRVGDLFCGIGNLSLPLARRGAVVKGLEFSEDAVAMARNNAELNGLRNQTGFEVCDLYAEECELPPDLSTLVLDPPRTGAGPRLAHWMESFNGSRIAYVSCNPLSFASDAAVLVDAGFRLRRVGVYDMFPFTAHVETLGYFERAI